MKKFLKENKTLLILMIIAIVCIVVSILLLFKYFYFGNGGSKYGTRLEGIEKVQITETKQSEIVTKLEENDIVEKANITIIGKRIDIRLVFTSKATLEDAKNIAVKALENFSEDELKFYDVEFTLKQEEAEKVEGFLIMGAKNVNGSNLVWNNNNKTTSEE